MGVGVGIVVIMFIIEAQKNKKGNAAGALPTENPSVFSRLGPENQEYPISKSGKTGAQTKSPADQETPLPRPSAKKHPDESQALLEENLKKTAELEEIQGKHDKLEKLLTEKSDELEKKTRELDNEVKNRKEFNKVKDLLEKEIKDLRDKNHKLQLELTAAKAETENINKRSVLLDEKVSLRDKELKEKEKQIDDLAKRLQTFASQGPVKATSQETSIQAPAAKAQEKIADSVPAEKKPPLTLLIEEKSEPLVKPIANTQESTLPAAESTSIEKDVPSVPPSPAIQSTSPEPFAPVESDAKSNLPPPDPGPSEPELEKTETTEEEKPHLNLNLLKLPDETKAAEKKQEKAPDIKQPPVDQSEKNPPDQKPAKEGPV